MRWYGPRRAARVHTLQVVSKQCVPAKKVEMDRIKRTVDDLTFGVRVRCQCEETYCLLSTMQCQLFPNL